MSFSYTPSNIDPQNAAEDLVSPVRWLLQDIDQATPEVQDEELAALAAGQSADLDQLTVVYRVAAHAATALWRRYAKQASFSSGGTSVQLGQRADSWKAVADQMTALATAAELAGDNIFGEVLGAARDSQFPLWRPEDLSTTPELDV
jgi:hypothetical protein